MTAKDEVMALHRSLWAQVKDLEEQMLQVRTQALENDRVLAGMVALETLGLRVGDIVEVQEAGYKAKTYRMKITHFILSHNLVAVSTITGYLVKKDGAVGMQTKRVYPSDKGCKITKIERPEKAEAESEMKVRVRLVFDDWRRGSRSVYSSEEGVRLSTGDLHSGSTFHAEIELGPDAAEELAQALEDGYTPIFYVIPEA